MVLIREHAAYSMRMRMLNRYMPSRSSQGGALQLHRTSARQRCAFCTDNGIKKAAHPDTCLVLMSGAI
jgi:hypothetical protein